MSDNLRVRKVAVLGAGVMGAPIAGHLVNASVRALPFDVPAREGERNGGAYLVAGLAQDVDDDRRIGASGDLLSQKGKADRAGLVRDDDVHWVPQQFVQKPRDMALDQTEQSAALSREPVIVFLGGERPPLKT